MRPPSRSTLRKDVYKRQDAHHANQLLAHLKAQVARELLGADQMFKRDVYKRQLYRKPGIKLLVDFITNPAFMATGNAERLQRLHDDIKGKDWFMALLDIEEAFISFLV